MSFFKKNKVEIKRMPLKEKHEAILKAQEKERREANKPKVTIELEEKKVDGILKDERYKIVVNNNFVSPEGEDCDCDVRSITLSKKSYKLLEAAIIEKMSPDRLIHVISLVHAKQHVEQAMEMTGMLEDLGKFMSEIVTEKK